MRRFIPFHPTQIASVVVAIATLFALVLSTLVAPRTASAQVAQSASFASAVPCLNTAPTFAYTRFEDTMFDSPTPAAYPGVQTVAPGGTPIPQATLAQLGSVYSLAYDDGAASGRERLFAAAYTRRLVNYGPRGAGGVYILERSGGAWAVTGSFSVPGAAGVPRTVGFAPFYDGAAIPGVGRTSLGGMVVSPDGRSLFIVNIGARRIERYTLTASGTPTHSGQFAIPFNRISGDPIVQADLYPFALQFYPFGAEQVLLVGVTDTAYRAVARGAGGEELDPIFNPDGSQQIPPSAHVLMLNLRNGAWSLEVSQSLDTPALRQRTFASSFYTELSAADRQRSRGWNPWRDQLQRIPAVGNEMRYPQPMLTNIELVRERAPTATEPDPAPLMLLGFRDRTGDVAFNNALTVPGGERTAVAQGDVLALRAVGGAWTVVGNDYYQDNALPNDPGISRHIENFSGALARIPAGGTGIGTAGDTLTMFGLGGQRTTGMYTLPNTAATGGAGSYTNLINVGGRAATKATNLGDVEVLCSYALVGGRVWDDRNTNSVQDAGEPGIANVRLEVFQGNNPRTAATIVAATTDAQGRYLFALPPNTPYNIRIAPASRTTLTAQGYRFTRTQVGSNRTADSDASQVWGYIEFARPGQSHTGAGLPLPLRESDQRSYDIGLMRQQPLGRVGDFVWNDLNANGIQDAGEPGIGGVTVTLEGVDSVALGPVNATTTTGADGRYLFQQLPPGVYRVRFSVPTGMRPTLLQRGGNSARDSDADTSTSLLTPRFNLLENQETLEWDFGLLGNADVTITKTGPATAAAGATFDYTLSYRNVGSSSATNVVVEDVLPSGLTFVSATPAPSSVSGQTVRWNLGTLNAGATGSIQLRVRAATTFSPASATSWARTNCVQISATPVDANSANNQSCATTTLQRPEISVTKTAPATVVIGDTFTYQITYRNTGTASANIFSMLDTLPTGLTFIAFTQNPNNACVYVAGPRRIVCSEGVLPAGASRTVAFTVRVDATSTATSAVNTASVNTTSTGDDPSNNTSTTTTAIQSPNVGTSISITPSPWPVGTTSTIRPTFRNTGDGTATSSVLTVTLPPTGTFTVSDLPTGCTYAGATRIVTCALGDLPPGASGNRPFTVNLPPDFPADSFTANAEIRTATPERTTDLSDNTATTTVSVVRPNVWVGAMGPDRIVGQGSVFWYVVDYGNQYFRSPSLTRAAENTLLRVTLPPDVTYQGVNGTPPTRINGQVLEWDLGTLNPRATGQLTIVVQTNVPAGAVLDFEAVISTTTPGDDPSDNRATVRTDVVQPPSDIPNAGGDLRLAIHSELDPNSQDGDAFNGVYISTGTAITWPAGEVLDFTPRLLDLQMDGGALPWPYEYRARVVGWSVTGFTVNGTVRNPQAADSRGRAGCRPGAVPSRTPQLLTGCRYAYLGGEDLASITNPQRLREDQMASQAHVYWTQPPAPRQRDDVYLYTLDPIEGVDIRIQVEVEVWIVNAYPGAPINDPSLPEIPVVPLPDPQRRLIEQTFDVTLLVPRSVIGPGSVTR
jgi:uncharacterized repeat protein (TIGR01451 family)